MGQVTNLLGSNDDVDHSTPPAVTPGVAVGTSMRFDLGHGRDIVLQTHFDRDAELSEWHAALDKMRQAGERQALHYQLRSAQANLKLQQRELKTAMERLPIAEKEYLHDTEARYDRTLELRQKQLLFTEECGITWASLQRRGEWKPSAAESSRIRGFETEIEKIGEEQLKADAERGNALKASNAEQISYKKTMEFYADEIADLEQRLKD